MYGLHVLGASVLGACVCAVTRLVRFAVTVSRRPCHFDGAQTGHTITYEIILDHDAGFQVS
jgi:hypothetical protein